MAGKATAIARAAEQEAALQELLLARFGRELQVAVTFLNRKIRGLIADFRTSDGRLVRTQQELGRAIRLRRDILDALEQAGVKAMLADAIDAPLDRLTAQVLTHSRIAARFTQLTPFDLQALTAFKEIRLAELFDLTERLATTLWRTVLDGVLGVRPTADLLVDLEDALDGTAVEARRLYDTAVSTYSRQVELLHSTGQPGELFLYVGPVDGKTRPFCLERVGKVYTRAEIDQWDNGQLPNAILSGGGYNCRHRNFRLSVLDDELRRLAGTGTRVPEVAAQVTRVKRAA